MSDSRSDAEQIEANTFLLTEHLQGVSLIFDSPSLEDLDKLCINRQGPARIITPKVVMLLAKNEYNLDVEAKLKNGKLDLNVKGLAGVKAPPIPEIEFKLD